MYNHQAEVIENVDVLMNNAGLPTYSDLVEVLRRTVTLIDDFVHTHTLDRASAKATEVAAQGEALLARIPS